MIPSGKYSWLLVVTLYLNHPNYVLTLGEADLEVDYTNNGVQVTLYQGICKNNLKSYLL